MPTPHVAQDDDADVATAPDAHAVQLDAPLATNVACPTLHVSQADAPLEALKRPDAHGTHVSTSVAPIAALEVPGAHLLQVARSGETYSPATQATHVLEPATADDPDAHDEHDADSALEKRPAAHVEHCVDAAGAYCPAAQARQTLEPLATPVEKPAAHVSHEDAPVDAE